MNVNLVEQSYWDENYTGVALYPAPQDDPVRNWIVSYFSQSQGKCMEIGVFPGRYLSIFGELGYELNGVDLTPRVQELKEWCITCGFQVGNFYQADFLNFLHPEQYDVVCSFGFVEHFANWEQVIQRKADFVKEKGWLVITAPNFAGLIQRCLHWLLDRKNYKRHLIQAMDPEKWAKILKEKGFEIIFYGYFGHFDFWEEPQKRNTLQMLALKIIHTFTPLLRKIKSDHRIYSPYCGLIAKRI